MAKFVPRQRKQKKRLGSSACHSKARALQQDSNVAELLPISAAEKEAKRQRLREELRAQQPKISAKKKKRLDKYIDTKLRKDENLELQRKLANTKADTSLLRSSKRLGTNRETRHDVLSRARKERSSGVNLEENDELLLEERRAHKSGVEEEDDDDDDAEENELRPSVLPCALAGTAGKDISRTSGQEIVIGIGLKRHLNFYDGGMPAAARKKRKGGDDYRSQPRTKRLDNEESEDSCQPSLVGKGTLLDAVSTSACEDLSASAVNAETSDDSSEASTSQIKETEENESNPRNRYSAFKDWANQRRDEASGLRPSPPTILKSSPTDAKVKIARVVPRSSDLDVLPAELEMKSLDRKVFHVNVERDVVISCGRLALPVVAEEQKIMEAIHNNPVTVICGATGSGKTTQIPQFLYEAGYGNSQSENPGMIGVTQPRRVAAVSMAKRVASELGKDGVKVAYKIRFEGSVQGSTAIKYMTDGILLREASEDISLRKYSAIIVDEAHERSKDTDILIGMLSRIVKLREALSKGDSNVMPLKLIIMSATMTIMDFTGNRMLFSPPPPVVHVEGRQYPVTIHWARRTSRDYLDEAYRKICKGHKALPSGGMLVFLTGQSEIFQLQRMLREAFPSPMVDRVPTGSDVRISGAEAPIEAEDIELGAGQDVELGPGQDNLDISDSESNQSTEEFVGGGEDDPEFRLNDAAQEVGPMHILPLYSLLPTSEQLRVFDRPPDGSRLVVLATNIAETSITIPGIRYVFDCGRAKERRYNEDTGVQTFDIGWISKASADQRTGRAGRTGSGHCYRLYSSAVYETYFDERSQPEIQRTSLEGVVLQLLSLGVPNILDKFPFPSPPELHRLDKAKRLLGYLGAVSTVGQLTELGRKMSALPLLPRFSKILLVGSGLACLPYTVALVAALSVPEIFLPGEQLQLPAEKSTADGGIFLNAQRLEEDAREVRLKSYRQALSRFSRLGGTSDVIKLLAAVLSYAEAPDPQVFCDENFLRAKAMREVHLLRGQLSHLLRADLAYRQHLSQNQGVLPPPSHKQVKYLQQVAASGFVDQVAIRADMAPIPLEQARKPKRAVDVPYLTLFPSVLQHGQDKAVYIHPSSVLGQGPARDAPQYIIYSSLKQSANSSKIRMLPLTPVVQSQLAGLTKGTSLQLNGKPIKEVVVDGPDGVRRERLLIPFLRGSAGGQEWPLPVLQSTQKKVNGSWVDI